MNCSSKSLVLLFCSHFIIIDGVPRNQKPRLWPTERTLTNSKELKFWKTLQIQSRHGIFLKEWKPFEQKGEEKKRKKWKLCLKCMPSFGSMQQKQQNNNVASIEGMTQYGIASHDGPLFSCIHLFCFDLFQICFS